MLSVATIMQSKPQTVSPDLPLPSLEQLFLSTGHSGFPVVENERLVGVVSRSDVVRSLLTERSRAEQVADYYALEHAIGQEDAVHTLEVIAAQVGVRLAGLHVGDVMVHQVVTIGPRESLRRLAEMMLEGRMHRLPVVDGDQLVGLVTSMDLVRAVAKGGLVETQESADAQRLLT